MVRLEVGCRAAAKRQLSDQWLAPLGVRTYTCDIEQIKDAPLPEPGPYDFVFCSGLLHHLSSPWELVDWMSKVASKYLFLDTCCAELPVYRCGAYVGEVHPGGDTATCGLKDYAFWPTVGDLILMLMQRGFVPRFIHRCPATQLLRQRIWIFAEKGGSSAELNGINPLRLDIREQLPDLSLGPQPTALNALEVHAATITGEGTPFNPETQRREAADAEIARLLTSCSWQVTAPLRWIYSRLHGTGADR